MQCWFPKNATSIDRSTTHTTIPPLGRRNRDETQHPSSNGGARAVLRRLFVGGPRIATNNQEAAAEHRYSACVFLRGTVGRKAQNGSRFCGAQQASRIVLLAKMK
jgi:hypothetical protein